MYNNTDIVNSDLIVKKLEWDELNIAHIARHNVSPDEVAEVCNREPVVKEGHENRLFVIGSTNTDRLPHMMQVRGVYKPIKQKSGKEVKRHDRR